MNNNINMIKCVQVSSKFENEWFMLSTIGKLLQYILKYVIVLCGISVISK